MRRTIHQVGLLALVLLQAGGLDGAGIADTRAEFERWHDQRREDFDAYRARLDAEFVRYLAEGWEACLDQGSVLVLAASYRVDQDRDVNLIESEMAASIVCVLGK